AASFAARLRALNQRTNTLRWVVMQHQGSTGCCAASTTPGSRLSSQGSESQPMRHAAQLARVGRVHERVGQHPPGVEALPALYYCELSVANDWRRRMHDEQWDVFWSQVYWLAAISLAALPLVSGIWADARSAHAGGWLRAHRGAS